MTRYTLILLIALYGSAQAMQKVASQKVASDADTEVLPGNEDTVD